MVDDHPIFRAGLARALDDAAVVVVAEAGSATEALSTVARARPDVVLLDIVLPDGDGLSVCRAIVRAHPAVRVVMLSSFDDLATIRASRDAGARAHLAKDAPAAEIAALVCRIGADPEVVHFPQLRGRDMTERELDVLERLALGWTNTAIAGYLALSPETVKSYLREVYGKLGVRDRASAVAEGRRRGLVPSPPDLGVPDDSRRE